MEKRSSSRAKKPVERYQPSISASKSHSSPSQDKEVAAKGHAGSDSAYEESKGGGSV